MKIKLSWIPFIPAALAMVALRLLSVFGNDDTGTISGMNALLFSYLAVGVALVLFVLCIFFNILDKKPHRFMSQNEMCPRVFFGAFRRICTCIFRNDHFDKKRQRVFADVHYLRIPCNACRNRTCFYGKNSFYGFCSGV